MPAVPIEVLPYIRGIQLVLSSYEGYTKGKRREADKLIRDEIKRAGTRARNHISNIQDIAFKTNKLTVAKIATDQVAVPIPIQKSILFSFSIFS